MSKEEVWYVGICTECAATQPAKYMERSKFENPPCKFCGGVVKVIREPDSQDGFDAFKRQEDRRRGLL